MFLSNTFILPISDAISFTGRTSVCLRLGILSFVDRIVLPTSHFALETKKQKFPFSLSSVVGFSFDLLAFNIFGYVAYSAFTVGVYAVPSIQEQYYRKYPGSSLPVMLNDVFFAVHGVFIGLVTCVQIAIYERNNQRVSRSCATVLSLTFLYCVIKSILMVINVNTALDFLSDLSYVKVFITVVKYIPQ
ncbi:cystinosin, partial [Paragonimus westermani]